MLDLRSFITSQWLFWTSKYETVCYNKSSIPS